MTGQPIDLPSLDRTQLLADSNAYLEAMTQDELIAKLKPLVVALKEASEERYRNLREWDAEAEKWKAEGDFYGVNFHQGMAAGANYCDLLYQRVIRAIEALLKEAETTGERR